jgi:hypothetical protein
MIHFALECRWRALTGVSWADSFFAATLRGNDEVLGLLFVPFGHSAISEMRQEFGWTAMDELSDRLYWPIKNIPGSDPPVGHLPLSRAVSLADH